MANQVEFDDTAYKNTQAKPTNLRENPFNQTSPRFATFDYKIRSTFGSSQYRISVFVNENFRKPVVKGSKKSPVNMSSVRRLNITREDESSAPSASSDDVKTEPFKTKIERSTSNFVSSIAQEDISRFHQAVTSQHRQSPRSKNVRKRHTQSLNAA